MFLSTELCYCPQGYVIVHKSTSMFLSMWWYSQTHVIVQRSILSSTELYYHQCGGILRPMLSSTELCYHLQGYVIVHRATLSSTGLCYCPRDKHGYVIIHGAMLSSRGVCSCPQGYVILHVVVFSDPCYFP